MRDRLRHTERERDRQTDRQRERQTHREGETERHRGRELCCVRRRGKQGPNGSDLSCGEGGEQPAMKRVRSMQWEMKR